MKKLNHLEYYRLPWNLTDNSISWLEPTAKCNLSCDGCYRNNENDSHKSLELIQEELNVFKKYRKCDGVSIAGGDPLTHPQIVDIVRMIKKMDLKPIINTNGHLLTKELLSELKKAGVFGFTLHVDSKQGRPGWKDANEIQLNELRYQYAKMIHDAGNISCSFNSTVYRDTLQYTPALIKWAQENIDIVQVIVFILYRAATTNKADYYIGPVKVKVDELVYNKKADVQDDIIADEVIELIRKELPDFNPCAYLNGSQDPSSFKWLLTGRIASKKQSFGYMGAKAMEIVQAFYHMWNNKYLAYSEPSAARKGKSLLLLSLFDKSVRKAFWKFYKNPFRIFTRLYYQTAMVIQPVDVLDDGRQNMCDGCPDMTVWNGKLVWSCRMEEQLKYGFNMQTFPKDITEQFNKFYTKN